MHNGYRDRHWSVGCLTLTPADWARRITIFLERYTDFADWHQAGNYPGRSIALLAVHAR